MFITNAGTLKAALSKVLPVVERRGRAPILAHVRLRVGNDLLTVSGANLDTQIDVEALVEGVPAAETAVDPRVLLSVLRQLSASTSVGLSLVDDGAELAWAGGSLKLPTRAASEFQDVPGAGMTITHTLDGSVAKALVRVLPFISTEETRYYLNGCAIIEHAGHISLAATDGYRLCIAPGGASLSTFRSALNGRALTIPRAAARLWLAMFPVGDVQATAFIANPEGGSRVAHFQVKANGLCLRTKIIDGAFPVVSRVVPTNPEKSLSFARSELVRACAVARSLVHGHYAHVTLSAKAGRASLLAKDSAAGSLTLDLGETTMEWEIIFNVNCLMSAVAASRGQTVTISGTDPSAPVLVIGSEAIPGEAIVIQSARR